MSEYRKSKRSALILCVFFCFVLMLFVQTETSYAASVKKEYVYATTSLNVRTGPGTSYKSVGVLKKNQKVELVKITKGSKWYQIKYNGKTRYASGKYLTKTSPKKNTSNKYVYATTSLNVRTGPGTSYKSVGVLKKNQKVELVKITKGSKWYQIKYNGKTRYASGKYLTTKKPDSSVKKSGKSTALYSYKDKTASITINKEWYGTGKSGAYCYVAHLKFSDYSRFGTSCANGKYKNGYETTSHAAKRLNAVFAVNGCYSAPYLNYAVMRSGTVWNDKACYTPGVYSRKTGVFSSPEAIGVAGQKLSSLKKGQKVTDTFCFGPAFLINGKASDSTDASRAQRTFIGTNGKPGDIWIVVSEGRKVDGVSAGLTYKECANLLKSKGCTFGIPLDGGGSSTMVFKGKVLNHLQGGSQRAVVDFVYFK